MKKPKSSEIEQLATALSQAHLARTRAGRALHDRVGPLLTGAGMQLQLLLMDQPKTSKSVAEVLQTLDEALDQVREVSQTLAPSAAYRIGLEGALRKLVQERQAGFPGSLDFIFSAKAKLEQDLIALLYDAVEAILSKAMARSAVTKIAISVIGEKRLEVRIQDNGRPGRKQSPTIQQLLAQQAGFIFSEITRSAVTRQGTIVLIRHGISRPSRG